MRLNIRLCITVALFAAVQPATASEFNQVIEDFDRYIQTEKASGNFPVSVQQPGRSPETRVTPLVNTAGKATQSQRQGTRKAARTGKRTVSSAQESRTQAQKTDTTTPGISVPAQCENIVVREPVVVTNPVPIGYPQWSPAYLVRDSQKWGGNHRGFVFSPVPSRMTSSLTLTPEALFAILGEPFRSMTYFSDLPLTVARVLKPETWFTPSDPQKQLRLTRLKLQDVKRELASLNEKYRNVQHNYEQALADIAKKETELSNLTLANNELQAAAKGNSAKLTAELEQNRKTIDSLNQQISENLARFGQAEGQVTALTAEKASLEKQIAALRVGPGLDQTPENEMGPLISSLHRNKVLGYIDSGESQGASLRVDGRRFSVKGHEQGYFVGPTLFDNVTPEMTIYKEEIFGPVLSVVRVADYSSAVELINRHEYGNGTAIFTRDGGCARRFCEEVQAGMVGVNVPIPVPMAFHSFGGWKRSIFGALNVHGNDGVRFYTRMKTVTARWPEMLQDTEAAFSMPTLG